MAATLIGSEKQVQWAEQLRSRAIAGLEQARGYAVEDDETDLAQLYANAIVAAQSVTSASVWIELRSWPSRTLANALAGHFPKAVEDHFAAAHQLSKEINREAQFWAVNQ